VRIAGNANAQPRALQAARRDERMRHAGSDGRPHRGGDDVDALTAPENISADIEISLDRAALFR